MKEYLTVKQETDLYNLTPKCGDIAFVESLNKFQMYVESIGWVLTDLIEDEDCDPSNFKLSLYDLNKQILANLPELSSEEIKDKKNILREYANKTSNDYHMLLNNELRYYTLFKINNAKSLQPFENEVIECLKDLGKIKAIDFKENNTIEIWIEDLLTEENFFFVLFPYDRGVITCQ